MYTDVHFLMMPSVAASLTDEFVVRQTSQIVCRFSLMLRNGVMQQFPKFILWKLLHFKEGLFVRRVEYPDACVVTKGIKADCNHLMRTTYPDACVGGC